MSSLHKKMIRKTEKKYSARQLPGWWVLPKINCPRVSGTFEVLTLRPFGLKFNHLGLKRGKGIVKGIVIDLQPVCGEICRCRYARPTGESLSFQYEHIPRYGIYSRP